MTVFNPPPTYADPVVVNTATGKSQFNPIWLKWFLDITAFISANGGGTSSPVDHESLSGLLGGTIGEHYHFNATQYAGLNVSFTGTGNLVKDTNPIFSAGVTVTGTVSAGSFSTTGAVSGGSISTTGTTSAASFITGSTTMMTSSVSFTNGAAAAIGTLTNAPTAGNPTKWIPVNDNGTVRYVPAW